MKGKNQNAGYIYLFDYKYIFGAVLLSVLLYNFAAGSRFGPAKARGDSLKTVTIQTKKSPPISGEKLAQWDVIEMRVTAYCWCKKCCGKHSDGITANGHRIRIGDTFVAADKKYRFGTEMVVPSYNNSQPVKVLDRGRVIRGNRLDVFFNSHQRAKVWGVRYLPVKVRAR
jgi:3D (Asp-Asp-Asp) domain-containing protein